MKENKDMENSGTTNVESFQKKVWIGGSILALICIAFLLFKALFSVLLLVFAGIIIAVYFYGIAGLFQKHFNWPPTLSIIISVLVNVLLIVSFFWFIGARIEQQVSELSDTLPSSIQNAKEQISRNPVGHKLIQFYNSSNDSKKTFSVVQSFFSSSFGILSDLYIVVLLALFFTASPGLYKKGIIRLLPVAAKKKGEEILNKQGSILKKWLKGQIFGIFFIAVLTAAGLLIVGMPLILTLSLIAGILNFIPNFGPIVALIPAVLIALTQGPETALIVVAIYTLIQVIQSSVSQPLVQKKMANIPPVLTIMAQVAMGAMAGFWGVLLATPFVAIVMILVEELYIKQQPGKY